MRDTDSAPPKGGADRGCALPGCVFWLLPILLFVFTGFVAPLLVGPHHPAYGSLTLVLYGSMAYLADFAWRASTGGSPTYLRHGVIFGALVGPATLSNLCGVYMPTTAILGIAGAALGLCLSSLPFLFGSRATKHGWASGDNRRPDASRALLIVADPHWGMEPDSLADLHGAARAMPEADWLFLGDVFDVWVGVKVFETRSQREFLAWVAERRAAGRWVGLWLGNREYFLDCRSHLFDYMGEGVGGYLMGEPFVFEHGDLINRADRRYRLWNLVSRSLPFMLFAGLMPAALARRMAPALERALKSTNMAQKANFPTEEFQKAVAACGAPLLLTGHFHTRHEVPGGLSIPWAHDGEFLLWRNGGFEPVFFGSNTISYF